MRHLQRLGLVLFASGLLMSASPVDAQVTTATLVVHRGMNFRFHQPTADALRVVMTAARVSTVFEPEKVISGATPTK